MDVVVRTSHKACHYWRAGRCNRHSCQFLHTELPRTSNDNVNTASSSNNVICKYFLAGNCKYGQKKCRFLHKWFIGDGTFSLVTPLQGHQKPITGISLPSGSDKLYSASKDESVRVWDCTTGQCVQVVNMGGEVGCMISEGSWIFVGLQNAVKVWNTQSQTEFVLDIGQSGAVCALAVSNDMLFAGTLNGSILVWKFNVVGNCFEPLASLHGHAHTVVSLVVGANKLYSASRDNAIKVWDLGNSLQCVQTLVDHTSVVMSLLCWDQFLISCSLDDTIKIWAMAESGSLEVYYTHHEEHGVLALAGMLDDQGKPVLICSLNDDTVRLYDLPSLAERGKIFAKEEVRRIQVGSQGLFFTGDGAGDVMVWKWSSSS